jgi:beta-xylosidase
MNELKVALSDTDKEVTNTEEKIVESTYINAQSRTNNGKLLVWLRIDADFRPVSDGIGGGRDVASFFYSLDGSQWTKIGSDYKMGFDYRRFFMGTKFGIFCYATKKRGGWVDIDNFIYTKQ